MEKKAEKYWMGAARRISSGTHPWIHSASPKPYNSRTAFTIYNLLNLNRNNKSQIELILFVFCTLWSVCVCSTFAGMYYTSDELNYFTRMNVRRARGMWDRQHWILAHTIFTGRFGATITLTHMQTAINIQNYVSCVCLGTDNSWMKCRARDI